MVDRKDIEETKRAVAEDDGRGIYIPSGVLRVFWYIIGGLVAARLVYELFLM